MRQQFVHKLDAFRYALQRETHKQYLGWLLDHLDDLLEFIDCTVERERFREQLVAARRVVDKLPFLRVVP